MACSTRRTSSRRHADAKVAITSGTLEHSNVNVAKTLVNMIELARQYEMQINMIKASEENADAAAQMMRSASAATQERSEDEPGTMGCENRVGCAANAHGSGVE